MMIIYYKYDDFQILAKFGVHRRSRKIAVISTKNTNRRLRIGLKNR